MTWSAKRREHPGSFKHGSGATFYAAATVLALAASGCMETLNAGQNHPHGLLPVDERNPVILVNDSAYDNWQGEYAVLLANGGGPDLAGIIVNKSVPWPDIDANVAGWRSLVAAARDSGMRNLPDPIASIGAPLIRPANGDIDVTDANHSEGALNIVDLAKRLSLPYRPLVVVTGGRLTDVADAYLIDHSVKDRVVVVSSLGSLSTFGGAMNDPNGELDPWADAIVTSRFTYVQVSTFYDQHSEIPDSRLKDLPDNAFGNRLAAKQPNIWEYMPAADQVAILAVGLADFAVKVEPVSPGGVAAGATVGPTLAADRNGSGLLVREIASSVATDRFWKLLLDPKTYPAQNSLGTPSDATQDPSTSSP
jgi:hypothetical protein